MECLAQSVVSASECSLWTGPLVSSWDRVCCDPVSGRRSLDLLQQSGEPEKDHSALRGLSTPFSQFSSPLPAFSHFILHLLIYIFGFSEKGSLV